MPPPGALQMALDRLVASLDRFHQYPSQAELGQSRHPPAPLRRKLDSVHPSTVHMDTIRDQTRYRDWSTSAAIHSVKACSSPTRDNTENRVCKQLKISYLS